jgi:hypothetical protein
MIPAAAAVARPLRATFRTTVFFLKVLPTLPSRPIDLLTLAPKREELAYPTRHGPIAGDLYLPGGRGPHPGIVVCLGVVPFEVDHPQVPRLGEALARAGFAALLYWSPAMRDLRLDPDDAGDIALAYDALLARPDVDPERSGLLGTCVGGAFALLAAAQPLIRERISFVAAFAPYASMWTLSQSIASATRAGRNGRVAWPVDQLTRKVFVRSLTDALPPEEAELLRSTPDVAALDPSQLSDLGRTIQTLLGALSPAEASAALRRLPPDLRARLSRLSPINYLDEIHAPAIIFGHDVDDLVVPVDESRRLRDALARRPGARYTEFAMFQHADPTKRNLPPHRLLWQLSKFYRYVYPVFRGA